MCTDRDVRMILYAHISCIAIVKLACLNFGRHCERDALWRCECNVTGSGYLSKLATFSNTFTGAFTNFRHKPSVDLTDIDI